MEEISPRNSIWKTPLLCPEQSRGLLGRDNSEVISSRSFLEVFSSKDVPEVFQSQKYEQGIVIKENCMNKVMRA